MEGLILKSFIENQKRPKVHIASELGMSKQNLYKLFESHSLAQETIDKIERVFDVKWEKVKKTVNIDVLDASGKGLPKDYKDKYIESLERENKRLQRDLDLSLGEMAERQLYALSISQTNQQLLIELVAKHRKVSVGELSKEVGKENLERYEKLNERGSFLYTDR